MVEKTVPAPGKKGEAPEEEGEAPEVKGEAPEEKGKAPAEKVEAPEGMDQALGQRNPEAARRGRTGRWVRRIAAGLAGVIVVGVAAFLVAAQLGERKMHRRIDVDVPAVALRDDPQAVERGRYLFLSRGCMSCHGADGGGKVVMDNGKGLLIRAPNITPGGVVGSYSVPDWARTIRHGVKPDGEPVMVMPSEDFNRFTDDDLGALVAYLKSLPSVPGGAAIVELPMLIKAFYGIGAFQDAADKIDHRRAPSTPVPEGATAEYGAYVANACIGCHGPKLQGGRIPASPPEWPPAADLRPGSSSRMSIYANAEAFAAMLKTGKRPDGSEVSQVMPFVTLREMKDTDVRALFQYLRSLPSAEG
jgi:mono/diheme cytochrome c family protein